MSNATRTAGPFSVRGRLQSFVYAGRGVRTLLATQNNARLHLAATIAVVIAGAVLGVARHEWLALVLAIVAVWTAEAFNTAIEFVCDVASPDFHPLVAKAKDVAAAAVLVAAAGAAVVAAVIFWPYLRALTSG